MDGSSVRERWQGYCEALQKYGVPYDPSLVLPMPDQNMRMPHPAFTNFYSVPIGPRQSLPSMILWL